MVGWEEANGRGEEPCKTKRSGGKRQDLFKLWYVFLFRGMYQLLKRKLTSNRGWGAQIIRNKKGDYRDHHYSVIFIKIPDIDKKSWNFIISKYSLKKLDGTSMNMSLFSSQILYWSFCKLITESWHLSYYQSFTA